MHIEGLVTYDLPLWLQIVASIIVIGVPLWFADRADRGFKGSGWCGHDE